jgi:glycogen(starch) synthase
MAQRLGVRQRLVPAGYVPEHEVAGWFEAADAVVLPYRRTEQSGVAGLANAFRVPVIASTAGGLGEQFSGTPWTFPPRDVSRLAAVLEAFLSATPEQRSAAARLHRTIDVRTVAASTVDVYAAARAATGGLLHAT